MGRSGDLPEASSASALPDAQDTPSGAADQDPDFDALREGLDPDLPLPMPDGRMMRVADALDDIEQDRALSDAVASCAASIGRPAAPQARLPVRNRRRRRADGQPPRLPERQDEGGAGDRLTAALAREFHPAGRRTARPRRGGRDRPAGRRAAGRSLGRAADRRPGTPDPRERRRDDNGAPRGVNGSCPDLREMLDRCKAVP